MEQPITVFLGLGSNLGDKSANIQAACAALSTQVGPIQSMSSVYETQPWGNLNQDVFLNLALEICTVLAPINLLKTIKQIETDLGRINSSNIYGPRMIDIDILFYGTSIIRIQNPDLSIPHLLLPYRHFVLSPLNEIASSLVHPVLKLSVKEMAEILPEEQKMPKKYL
ncbi:MAG TPA: 2-amino-4-hydroxy-6-hydroxymethyldihydropteridine diphosphokinase [Dehalococcoidia bacterium]|nr:2-amino-4-hydroxy-6-hydroxymethyldihydropteridine diphosphokinase [Dehalococcoidia bacterium]